MKLSKSLVFNIALALLAASLIAAFSQEDFLKHLELSSLDLFFRLRGATSFSPNIVIVEISDSDISQVGRWPWMRSWHAAITKALSDLGAKAVYFDILFPEASSEEDDALFEEAIKVTDKVYLPFAFQLPSLDIHQAILPLPRFYKYLKGTGAINIYPDRDGILRRIPITFLGRDNVYHHSALKLAMDYLGVEPKMIKPDYVLLADHNLHFKIPTSGDGQMLVNWAGKWQDTFKHYSFLEVLNAYKDFLDKKKPSINIDDFKNSICLVGITAIGLYDIKPVSIQPEYPGMGVLATALSNILNKNFMREAPAWANLLTLYILALLPSLLIFGERPLREAIFVLLTGISYFILNFLLFENGHRIDLFTPLLSLVVSYSAVSIYNFVRISIERQSFFKMSVTDGLTGLYNIRYFKMLLDTEILLASADPNKKFVIVMSDVDHFKRFNDTYGHQVGDLVLKSVATVLKNSVRALDVVARYGGEEMIVLLRGSSLRDGVNVAEKIRKNIESCLVKDQNNNYNVTVSLGVSISQRGDTVDTVIKRTDDGLYKAKEAGRNRVSTVEAG